MPVTINGWTITNANATELKAALAEALGMDVADVDEETAHTYAGDSLRNLVKAKRRRDSANAASSDDVLT